MYACVDAHVAACVRIEGCQLLGLLYRSEVTFRRWPECEFLSDSTLGSCEPLGFRGRGECHLCSAFAPNKFESGIGVPKETRDDHARTGLGTFRAKPVPWRLVRDNAPQNRLGKNRNHRLLQHWKPPRSRDLDLFPKQGGRRGFAPYYPQQRGYDLRKESPPETSLYQKVPHPHAGTGPCARTHFNISFIWRSAYKSIRNELGRCKWTYKDLHMFLRRLLIDWRTSNPNLDWRVELRRWAKSNAIISPLNLITLFRVYIKPNSLYKAISFI